MYSAIIGIFVICFSASAYAKASENNIEEAIYNAWEHHDCKQATQLISELKDTSALADYYFYQAEAFEFGLCTDKNIDKAIEAYQKAYEITQTRSLARLGTLFYREKKDLQTAQKWLRTLAFLYVREPDDDVNTPENQAETVEFVKRVYSRSILGDYPFPQEEFDKAVKWAIETFNGSPKEIYDKALLFETGGNDYPVNANAASRLLHRSVKLGYSQAAWHKAQQIMGETGEKKERFLYRRIDPLKIAAYGGIVDAQVQLGRTYRDINKNERYLERAYEWFIFAQKNGARIQDEITKLELRVSPEKVVKIRKNIEQAGRVPQ